MKAAMYTHSRDKYLNSDNNDDKQITNFAEKCCDELNLNYKKIIPLKDIFLNYFNPKFNPYKIFE